MQIMSVGRQNKLFKPLNIQILAFNHSLILAAQIQQFIHVNNFVKQYDNIKQLENGN